MSYKHLIVLWNRVNFLNKDINVCCVSSIVCLPQVKSSSECSKSGHKHRIYSDTDGAMLSSVCGIESMIDFLHMFAMPEVWVVALLPICTVEIFW